MAKSVKTVTASNKQATGERKDDDQSAEAQRGKVFGASQPEA